MLTIEMKSNFIILVFLFFTWIGYPQDIDSILDEASFNAEIENSIATARNQVKVNLATLFWKTGSLSYERQLSKRWTLGITANYRPKETASFKSQIQDIFGNKYKSYRDYAFDVDQLKYGNLSISPEVKIYLGKSGAFKGFYIAGFVKYENIDMDYDLPLSFDIHGHNIDTVLPLVGDLKPWTGGLYVGHQWKINKSWYIDWQIIGGNIGGGTLTISAHQPLTQDEQERILSFANQIQDELDDVNYEVNSQGAKIWGNIPWAGLRTGVSIGYTF